MTFDYWFKIVFMRLVVHNLFGSSLKGEKLEAENNLNLNIRGFFWSTINQVHEVGWYIIPTTRALEEKNMSSVLEF